MLVNCLAAYVTECFGITLDNVRAEINTFYNLFDLMVKILLTHLCSKLKYYETKCTCSIVVDHVVTKTARDVSDHGT